MAIAFKSPLVEAVLIEEQERLQKVAEPVVNPPLPEPLAEKKEKKAGALLAKIPGRKLRDTYTLYEGAAEKRAENQRKWREIKAKAAANKEMSVERRRALTQRRLDNAEARRGGRKSLTLRIDAEVIAWFQAQGKGWSAKMVEVLRREMIGRAAGDSHEAGEAGEAAEAAERRAAGAGPGLRRNM